jgi:hypothetical protein
MMKAGRSIQDLAAEIAHQSASKKDYLADTRKLSLRPLNAGGADHPYANVILDGVNGGMDLPALVWTGSALAAHH